MELLVPDKIRIVDQPSRCGIVEHCVHPPVVVFRAVGETARSTALGIIASVNQSALAGHAGEPFAVRVQGVEEALQLASALQSPGPDGGQLLRQVGDVGQPELSQFLLLLEQDTLGDGGREDGGCSRTGEPSGAAPTTNW